MTERERWIVYPLVFFALGAALRDKFLQHVSTKELETQRLVVKQIECEELSVIDSTKRERVVARLTSDVPAGGDANADRFGVLVLIDSQGKELCGVTNNQLQVQQINCDEVFSKRVSIVDPQNTGQRLAILTSATASTPGRPTRRIGSLLLTDNQGAEIFGLVNDQMQMRSIACQSIAVVDPNNPNHVLAALASTVAQQDDANAPGDRIGVIILNEQQLRALRGTPIDAILEEPVASQPTPDSEASAPMDEPPQEPSADAPSEIPDDAKDR